MIPLRRGALSSSRRAKPDSKSRATREAGEDAAEGRRLQEHEDELERRVAGRVVEVRDVADPRQAAGERGEEEQREDQRRDQERRVDERVVDRAPGDAAGDAAEAPHVRTSRVFIAQLGEAERDRDEREREAEAERERLARPSR